MTGRRGYIINIPKKGDPGECKNYIGIMLLSVPGYVLSRIILDRMKEAVDGYTSGTTKQDSGKVGHVIL